MRNGRGDGWGTRPVIPVDAFIGLARVSEHDHEGVLVQAVKRCRSLTGVPQQRGCELAETSWLVNERNQFEMIRINPSSQPDVLTDHVVGSFRAIRKVKARPPSPPHLYFTHCRLTLQDELLASPTILHPPTSPLIWPVPDNPFANPFTQRREIKLRPEREGEGKA